MKVRWTKQTLRLRITPAELERLRQNQPVTETLCLPGSRWSIAVQVGSALTGLVCIQGVVTLLLTESDRDRLAAPETEGVYFRREDDPPMTYYIEKDFPCLHPRPQDAQALPSETFTAPFRP